MAKEDKRNQGEHDDEQGAQPEYLEQQLMETFGPELRPMHGHGPGGEIEEMGAEPRWIALMQVDGWPYGMIVGSERPEQYEQFAAQQTVIVERMQTCERVEDKWVLGPELRVHFAPRKIEEYIYDHTRLLVVACDVYTQVGDGPIDYVPMDPAHEKLQATIWRTMHERFHYMGCRNHPPAMLAPAGTTQDELDQIAQFLHVRNPRHFN